MTDEELADYIAAAHDWTAYDCRCGYAVNSPRGFARHIAIVTLAYINGEISE